MKALVRMPMMYVGVLMLWAGPAAAQAQYKGVGHRPVQLLWQDLRRHALRLRRQRSRARPQRAEAMPEMIDLERRRGRDVLRQDRREPGAAAHAGRQCQSDACGHLLRRHRPRGDPGRATRTPIDCIRTSVGAGGARQVHFAIPSPDERYIAVANQNGKLFERIDTELRDQHLRAEYRGRHQPGHCTTPNGVAVPGSPMLRPDNAPICPIIEATSRYVFVTLRGGGLFVVDATTTPMQIVAEYDIDTVHPNGCLGAQVGDKMYVDSGGGTPTHLFGADIYAFPVTGFSPLNPPNIPLPRVVLSDTSDEADAHGATLTNHQRYLWVADRGRNFIWVHRHADGPGGERDSAGRRRQRRPDARSAGHLAQRQPRLHVPARAEPAHGRSARQHRQHARRGRHQGPCQRPQEGCSRRLHR